MKHLELTFPVRRRLTNFAGLSNLDSGWLPAYIERFADLMAEAEHSVISGDDVYSTTRSTLQHVLLL